jgi:hypothetical protein
VAQSLANAPAVKGHIITVRKLRQLKIVRVLICDNAACADFSKGYIRHQTKSCKAFNVMVLLETGDPPMEAVTLTTEVVVPAPADAGLLIDTLVVVPDVVPVEAVDPDICVKLNVTLVLGIVLTVAVAVAVPKGEVFKSLRAVTLVAGLAPKVNRAQTSCAPTYTRLIKVLPIRISVMLAPPTAIGIV